MSEKKQDKKYMKEYYEKNKKKRNALSKKWRERNKEKSNMIHREWQKKRTANDPYYRMNMFISRTMRRSLKNGWGGKWQDIVGYTAADLKAHLEAQFTPKMNWNNHGAYWHIEHRRPLNSFTNHKEAWNLTNIRPLEKMANLRKSGKLQTITMGG